MKEDEMRTIVEIKLRNLLSFGAADTEPVALKSLNVLIGPNGSGKSNLIEAVSLMRSAPGDILAVIRRGGGVGDWIWKGDPEGVASIDTVIINPQGKMPLRHVLAFRNENQTFRMVDECIENEKSYPNHENPYFYYQYKDGNPVINVKTEGQVDAKDDQAQMMATCIETWIMADHEALRNYFGSHLRENALIPLDGLESRSRHELLEALKSSTNDCGRNKGYEKGERSFQILAKLNTKLLEENLLYFKRFKDTLKRHT
jgi:hypothetical protein